MIIKPTNCALDSLLHSQGYVGDVLAEGMVKQSPHKKVLVHDHYHHVQHSSQRNPKATLLNTTAVCLRAISWLHYTVGESPAYAADVAWVSVISCIVLNLITLLACST
jgi:hypothetical protein